MAITVSLGWPWWGTTAIAAGVFAAGALLLTRPASKTVRAVVTVVVVEAAAVAIVAPFVMSDMTARGAALAMATAADRDVVHVIEHEPAANVRTFGNVQVFANRVFDQGDTHAIGRDHGFCVHIAIGSVKPWECMYTTELPGGSITIEGNYTEANGMPPSAIIGGTGKYADARGYMVQRTHDKAGTEFDEFFHVTR